jgi:hypothetical protein
MQNHPMIITLRNGDNFYASRTVQVSPDGARAIVDEFGNVLRYCHSSEPFVGIRNAADTEWIESEVLTVADFSAALAKMTGGLLELVKVAA